VTSNIDDTHRPDLVSWVDAANSPTTEFPLQNLPLGCYRAGGATRPATAALRGS